MVINQGGEPEGSSQVLQYIKKHPGTHLRELQRELNLAMGTVQYHIYRLEKEKKIVARRNRGQKRFYANLVFGDRQIDILDIISQDAEREIILYLIQKPGSSQKELSGFLNRSPATTYWHITKLTDAGLIEVRREKEFVRYELTCDKSEILELIRNYHRRIWERWASRLADLLTDASGIEQKRPLGGGEK